MHHPKRTWLLCLLAFLLAAPASAARQLPASDPAAAGLSAKGLVRVDAMAEGYVRRGAMPGVLIVVAHHGRIVHTYSVGARDIEADAPMATDTIFRIYSMTKPITGVAVMQLLERDMIHLSDPVSRFLPEFANLTVWIGGSSEAPETEPARTMTIEHLLTHTSGLTYGDRSADGVAAMYAEARLYSGPDLEAFVRRLARLPLASQPGTRWEYSVSMDVLGRIVETVAEKPFDTYLEDEILQPLGMVDTGFRVPDEKLSRLAALYRRTDDGGLELTETPAESDYRSERRVPFGGHGLVSTAADYLRFATMLVNGGELDGVRILSRKSVDLMLRDHLGAEYGQHPLTSSWMGDGARGLGFAFTGAVVRDGAANGIPGSTGAFFWGGAASTFFWLDRDRGLVGLQFTQLMPSDAYPIREQFRRLTYEALAEMEAR